MGYLVWQNIKAKPLRIKKTTCHVKGYFVGLIDNEVKQVIAPAVVIDLGKVLSKVKSLVAVVTIQRLKNYKSVSTYTFGNVNQNKNDNQEAKDRRHLWVLMKVHYRIELNERNAIGWALNEDAKQNPNLENEPKRTPNLEMNSRQTRPGTIEADAHIHVNMLRNTETES